MKPRCDACGAEAKARAVKGLSELHFCLHHGNEYLDALEDQGWVLSILKSCEL